jgi:hypothetical protein
MACDIAIHDRKVVFRNMWATGICPDGALVQRGFESPKNAKHYLILKLTELLAGWKLLDKASCLPEPSVDFALRGADGTALEVYACLPKSNKLHGTRRRNSQPPKRISDTISTVKSSRVDTDGDSL